MNEENHMDMKKRLGALAMEDAFRLLSEGETLWAPCIGTEYRLDVHGNVLGRVRGPGGEWSMWTVRDCMNTVLVRRPTIPVPLCATCRRTTHSAEYSGYSFGREGVDGMQYVEAVSCDAYRGSHRALDVCTWYVGDDRKTNGMEKTEKSDRKDDRRYEI